MTIKPPLSRHRRLANVAVAAAVATLVAIGSLSAKPPAGKGGGGNDPPPQIPAAPGTIYFWYDGQPMAMDGNGGNKRPASDADITRGPGTSNRTYPIGTSNGGRWSLYAKDNGQYDGIRQLDGTITRTVVWHRDLYVSRPDGQGEPPEVRLTNSYGVTRVTGLATWSKDDSFVSFEGRTVETFAHDWGDGEIGIILDRSTARQVVVRLPVGGVDLEDWAAVGGQWPAFTPEDDEWEVVVEAERNPNIDPVFNHTWLPDERIVYRSNNPADSSVDLYVGDPTTGVTETLRDAAVGDGIDQIRWLPLSERIAYTFNDQVWTVAADGSGDEMVLGEGTHELSKWSPDGVNFVYDVINPAKGRFKYDYEVVRFTLDGGAIHDLTSDLDVRVRKGVAYWGE
jgi:hypothetical protein